MSDTSSGRPSPTRGRRRRHRAWFAASLPGLSVLACLAACQFDAEVHATQAAGTPQRRPDILVIVTDDQGWADIGYHNPAVYSPELDALAAAGARFTWHYVMPQCTPTRVALLTGRYPSRFGPAARAASNEPALPLSTPTLADVAAANGYEPHLVGKWHLGSTPANGPNRYGFAHSYGSLAGAVGMYDHRYRQGPFADTWHRDGALIEGAENGRHATDLIADEAIRVLQQDREQPLLLYVAFHAVHTPLDERGTHVERPTQLDPDDPTRWLDESDIEWFHDPDGKIQRERDPEKRLLLAAVHHLDHAVGRIVAALHAAQRADNTLILFTSDNGPQVDWPGNAYPDDLKLTDFNQPLPMRGKKVDVYEGGIHVPGFAVWPGRIVPGTIDAPVHCVDWLPTIERLIAGDTQDRVRAPQIDVDGVDLGPLLFAAADARAAVELPDRDLYWTWNSVTNRWALRHGNHKIVRYGKGAPTRAEQWQLFDLVADPREAIDIGDHYPEIRQRLHERFLRQHARDAD